MASAATAVPVRSKKTKNRPPRSNSSSDTESANSIPDSDDEAGPPIILEDVAPSEKLKTKKVKKTSEKPVEAASVEIEAEKKHKKHKKHKTADGEEKPEKHKKKHKERSESPGGTKKSKNKSSKKTKETPEAIVGGKNTADDLYQHS